MSPGRANGRPMSELGRLQPRVTESLAYGTAANRGNQLFGPPSNCVTGDLFAGSITARAMVPNAGRFVRERLRAASGLSAGGWQTPLALLKCGDSSPLMFP
jgi:hypothetical protein